MPSTPARRSLATVVMCTCLAANAAVVVGDTGLPPQPIATNCTHDGDVCTAILKHRGRIKFDIRSVSFDGNYDLCVRSPSERVCKTFDLEAEGLYVDRIDWLRHFSDDGPGRYKIVWKRFGERLGKPLYFNPASV
jgi:hypothetical protein